MDRVNERTSLQPMKKRDEMNQEDVRRKLVEWVNSYASEYSDGDVSPNDYALLEDFTIYVNVRLDGRFPFGNVNDAA